MMDEQKYFDQPAKNNMRTYDSIRNIATGQGYDCTTSCLLYDPCFNEHYKLIAIDLSKQKVLNADLKGIQQINFTGNPQRAEVRQCFSLLKKQKKLF